MRWYWSRHAHVPAVERPVTRRITSSGVNLGSPHRVLRSNGSSASILGLRGGSGLPRAALSLIFRLELRSENEVLDRAATRDSLLAASLERFPSQDERLALRRSSVKMTCERLLRNRERLRAR